MNNVLLTGIVKGDPRAYVTQDGANSAFMSLSVKHRTENGTAKFVLFPLRAWHGSAKYVLENVQSGDRIAVSGYLTINPEGHMEVTVSEILSSGKPVQRAFNNV